MYYLLSVTHCRTLPDKRCLFHDMCLYKVMMTLHFFNYAVNDAESTKNRNYVIIASLKSETMGKLINKIPEASSIMRALASARCTGVRLYT